jgi:hypothetical protein
MAAYDRGKTGARGPALFLALAVVPAVAEAGWGPHPAPVLDVSGPRPVARSAARPVFGGRPGRPLMISGYAGEVYGPGPRRALVPTGLGASAARPYGAPCGACGSGR